MHQFFPKVSCLACKVPLNHIHDCQSSLVLVLVTFGIASFCYGWRAVSPEYAWPMQLFSGPVTMISCCKPLVIQRERCAGRLASKTVAGKSQPQSYDERLAKDLWNLSSNAIGVPHDPILS